jgi:hypothetical protein
MLSILCLSLWGGAVKGLSVGVFIGGLMINGKHNYEREDVKEKELEKWYLNDLEQNKYPLIVQEAARAKGLLAKERADLEGATTLTALQQKTSALKIDLARRIITDEGLRYFVSDRFKNNGVRGISSSAILKNVQTAYDAIYDELVGKLGQQNDENYSYDDATGAYRTANEQIKGVRESVVEQLKDAAKISGNAFQVLLKTEIGSTPEFLTLEAAAKTYTTSNTDPNETALKTAGKEAVKVWVNQKMRGTFLKILTNAIDESGEWLDDPLERALKAYQDAQKEPATADQYPFTSPIQEGAPSGEEGRWKTFKGETKSKRIGLTYGFSVGYEKEMNKNHAFVGGNAFAKQDTLTIKYDLKVDEGAHASYGELEAKPLYTFGVTVVAGKHLNPVFSVFGRGTFEFTKSSYTYNVTNDSPNITNGKWRKQELGKWIKQAAVGVGARYNFAPLWSAEACYDFVPATKTTVRDFNKLGEDERRRGYIYTTSQHRVFLKVVRFFNV